MKNSHSIVTGVLAVAVIILFILQFTGGKRNSSGSYKTDTTLVNKGVIRIKYVMTDSIQAKWDFSKDLVKIFQADQAIRDQRISGMEATLNAKQNQLKVDYPRLTDREIESRSIELQKYQQQCQMDFEDLNNKAGMQQQQMAIQLSDSLNTFFQTFAKKVNADLILNNTSMVKTVWYIDPSMDVTDIAIKDLNERYKKYKPKTTETNGLNK